MSPGSRRSPVQRMLAGLWSAWRGNAPSPPPLRVWMVLALVFLGFGVLVGRETRPSGELAASSRPQLKVIVPSSSSAKSPEGSNGGGSTQAPETTPEETPEPSSASTGAGGGSGAGSGSGSAGKTSVGKGSGKGSGSKGSGSEGSGSGSGSGNEGSSSGSAGGEGSTGVVRKSLPAIKHVFLIVLATEPYASVFGPESKASYIPAKLEKQGLLLGRYDAVAHEGLADAIALVSGQGPTPATAADCPTYAPIVPGTAGAAEQVQGEGCIYPQSTQTLPQQLSAKHRSWRAYIGGIDETGSTEPACAHPATGAADPSAGESGAGSYATFRNPFVYFQSLLGSGACATGDVGLAQLRSDLASPAKTPSFSYIVPDRCHDGSVTPCKPGAPAGVAPVGAFLAQTVPEITSSKAYRAGGLIVVTSDEAPAGGELGDSSSCCAQPRFPNLPAAAGPAGSARGGGVVGALLISPFVKGGSISQEPYNHFSLLRTIEDLFGLPHLGYAGAAGVKALSPALFAGKG